MNLEDVYIDIKNIIDDVDFSLLWDGFVPLKFAIYNADECFFDGMYIDKTDAFIANTAILHNNEYIAIWNIMGVPDLEILASKIIHEMFHGFQMENNESRFPDELESLVEYSYTNINLSMKLEENKLIEKLLMRFDEAVYERFKAHRKYRLLNFKYEYEYESAIEQIEGSATYVELNALKQISKTKYQLKMKEILGEIRTPINYVPIRIVSYSIGALLFELIKKYNLFDFECFSDEALPVSLLGDALAYKGELPFSPVVQEIIRDYNSETESIIKRALLTNKPVLDGEYDLLGVNVYDARYYNNYIVSRYFIMYMNEGNQSELYGDFVLEMNADGKISRAYEIIE